MGLLFLWFGQGVLFYTLSSGWSFAKSFFYVVDSGLSIGFGAFPEEIRWHNDTLHQVRNTDEQNCPPPPRLPPPASGHLRKTRRYVELVCRRAVQAGAGRGPIGDWS